MTLANGAVRITRHCVSLRGVCKVPSLKLSLSAALAAVVSICAWAAPAQAVEVSGQAVYEARCASCHEAGVERTPTKADLSRRSHGDIVNSLKSGLMKAMATGMSDAEIDAVATWLTSAQTPAVAAAPPAQAAPRQNLNPEPVIPEIAVRGGPQGTDPMCKVNPPIRPTAGDWPNMGIDDASTRFQRRPGLAKSDVPKLKVKWAFAMAGGGQPVVVGDWLWITNRSGKFYALDPSSGCVRWVVSDLVARTTPIVMKSTMAPSGWIVIVGANNRVIRTFDAQTGKEIWRSPELESHGSSLLTGTPVVVGERLLVPISSIEEATAMSPSYACCTFRGSLAAVDMKTGKLLWKTYTVHEERKVIREKANGQQVTGPAGAAIWAAPSIDRKRGVVYVVTGDSYTDVDTVGSDAVMAVEVATGKIRWQRQVTEGDNFIMGCGRNATSGNCPTPLGPDFDFGATPILMKAKGKDVLVAGQKSGLVYGIDPDSGKILWTTRVGAGSALGGVEWGIGADDRYVYVPNADFSQVMAEYRPGPEAAKVAATGNPSVSAIDPATGRIVWQTKAPKAPCTYASDKGQPSRCARAQAAAPAVIPGVVFEGGLDGWFRAYDAADGRIIWEHSTTAQRYDTVNGLKQHPGGGIDGMGPTIANGMVFLMSGNNGAARVGSNGVNVLLAYSVDGK
jgi:polyvinyl alcohol dehydrogenase (cytochrome)